jgi:peptidoglycan/xylan/chitin deacetylase (PgdA/CDA1 family)
MVKPLFWQDQDDLMKQLKMQFVDAPPARSNYRALTREELRRLSASPLISIGAHTVHHCALGYRPDGEQRREIRDSVQSLRVWTGQCVDTFSYPYGEAGDIGRRAPSMVADVGCILARANVPGLVTAGSARLRVPGFLVRDWSAPTLAGRLKEYLEAQRYDSSAAERAESGMRGESGEMAESEARR